MKYSCRYCKFEIDATPWTHEVAVKIFAHDKLHKQTLPMEVDKMNQVEPAPVVDWLKKDKGKNVWGNKE